MTAVRKIEDEREARRCLAAVAASGLEAREWAHRHGIDARSLNVWRINLARRGTRRHSAKTAGLVELVPISNVRMMASPR